MPQTNTKSKVSFKFHTKLALFCTLPKKTLLSSCVKKINRKPALLYTIPKTF